MTGWQLHRVPDLLATLAVAAVLWALTGPAIWAALGDLRGWLRRALADVRWGWGLE